MSAPPMLCPAGGRGTLGTRLAMTLSKRPATASHRNLVFSSVGDRSNLPAWLRGRRNFDLWVTYYGGTPGRYRDVADYYHERSGSKFQNLFYAYNTWRELFDQYLAVLVMDDDLLISGSRISRLFDIRERYDLWALQPAFSQRGKISWPITRANPHSELRYTNFIEMACPLFRKDKLDAFLAVYDPELVGWGCDWWFLETMGEDLRDRVAVVDRVTCINPHDSTKGVREIDRLSSTAERRAIWERMKEKYDIRSESRGVREYRAIPRPFWGRQIGRLVGTCDDVRGQLVAVGRRAARLLRRGAARASLRAIVG